VGDSFCVSLTRLTPKAKIVTMNQNRFGENMLEHPEEEMDIVPRRHQTRQEAEAASYREQLRREGGSGGDTGGESDGEIHADELERLIAGNDTYSDEDSDNVENSDDELDDAVSSIPSRGPIFTPEWGDDLTARYIQEQRNILSQCGAVNGVSPSILIREPPTGPEGCIMIPATLGQFLAIYDAMKLSQDDTHRTTYPEPAFDREIQQFFLTLSSGWIDRNPFRMSIRLQLQREVTRPIAMGNHFLVAIMRPNTKTNWIHRQPNPPL
jgi:hypothetical protein